MPTVSGVWKSRWKPSWMSCPSPPWPMSAVTVTRPMVVTVAMRTPAMIAGNASGSSTRRSWPRARVAHADRRFLHSGGHAVEAGHDVPHEDEQRVRQRAA